MSAARKRYGVSWCWRRDHDWSVWLVRGYGCITWRFNCGPLHIVRFA